MKYALSFVEECSQNILKWRWWATSRAATHCEVSFIYLGLQSCQIFKTMGKLCFEMSEYCLSGQALSLQIRCQCVHEAGLNTRGSFSRPSLSWCLSTSEYFLSDKMPLVPRCWKEHSYFKCFELQMSPYSVWTPLFGLRLEFDDPPLSLPRVTGKVLVLLAHYVIDYGCFILGLHCPV